MLNDNAFGGHMYLEMRDNLTYEAGDYGHYAWQAPYGTHIYQTRFFNTAHQPYYSRQYQGIRRAP